MKKISAVLLAIVMIAVLASCSTKSKEIPIPPPPTATNGVENVPEAPATPTTPEEPVAEGNPYNILSYQPLTSYDIAIQDAQGEIQSGMNTDIKHYTTGSSYPDGMVIVDKNADLSFNVTNHLADATSIHWHGLDIPNDQDGPSVTLQPGDTKPFNFTVAEAGTYWYHPHMRPILPQLNSGLYAPFIVKEAYDSQYAGDYVLTLDDWTLSPEGKIDEAYTTGEMEITGNVETVNGRTGANIYPVTLKKGEIAKLRFINASTAQSHTLKLEGQQMRVTHLDGYSLPEPYMADSITLSPGERVDVELKATKESGTDYILNERNFGLRIPVVYAGMGTDMESPFVAPASRAFESVDEKAIDFEYVLNSRMKEAAKADENAAVLEKGEAQSASQMDGMNHGSNMSGMDHGTMSSSSASGTDHSTMASPGGMKMDADTVEWTLNDKTFPEMDVNTLKVGQVYKIRFTNKDTEMMHAMAHPIHIHGEHFQVVSLNGKKPDRELVKDTISVLPGEYVDIAIRFDNPGTWMLHCHIIDHEDNGMLTVLKAE